MRESGFTLVEMMIAIVVAGILAVMAVAGLNRARASANESSAIASLKTINMAQISYNSACGRGGYAQTLVILGRPPGAGATAGYIDAELAAAPVVEHSGYRLRIQVGASGLSNIIDCNNNQTLTGYYASAVPVTFGYTGARSFATSHVGAIWQNSTDTAPSEPFGPPSELYK